MNTKATEGSFSQEAIFSASAKLLQTLSFPWDENSTNAEMLLEGATVLSGIVDVGGTPSLDFNATVCRPGLITRFCRTDENGNEVNVSTLSDDNTNPFIRGLDDCNSTSLMNNVTMSAEGYKNEYRLITTIAYVSDSEDNNFNEIDYNASTPFGANNFILSDTNVTGPTNLRLITVTTQRKVDADWEDVTILRAYAANIGETKPYKRTY